MRDDRHRWTPQSAHFDPIMIGAVTLQEIKLNRQIMVSGPAVRDTFGPATGWPAVVSGDSYTLSLRRDRVLIVNGPAMAAGWDAAQDQAVSDVTDGVQVFDLQGPFALSALQRGAELSVDTASASVARLLFGMNVFLYRHDQHDRFRIHITRGLGEALYQNLCHAMQSAVVHASER